MNDIPSIGNFDHEEWQFSAYSTSVNFNFFKDQYHPKLNRLALYKGFKVCLKWLCIHDVDNVQGLPVSDYVFEVEESCQTLKYVCWSSCNLPLHYLLISRSTQFDIFQINSSEVENGIDVKHIFTHNIDNPGGIKGMQWNSSNTQYMFFVYSTSYIFFFQKIGETFSLTSTIPSPVKSKLSGCCWNANGNQVLISAADEYYFWKWKNVHDIPNVHEITTMNARFGGDSATDYMKLKLFFSSKDMFFSVTEAFMPMSDSKLQTNHYRLNDVKAGINLSSLNVELDKNHLRSLSGSSMLKKEEDHETILDLRGQLGHADTSHNSLRILSHDISSEINSLNQQQNISLPRIVCLRYQKTLHLDSVMQLDELHTIDKLMNPNILYIQESNDKYIHFVSSHYSNKIIIYESNKNKNIACYVEDLILPQDVHVKGMIYSRDSLFILGGYKQSKATFFSSPCSQYRLELFRYKYSIKNAKDSENFSLEDNTSNKDILLAIQHLQTNLVKSMEKIQNSIEKLDQRVARIERGATK